MYPFVACARTHTQTDAPKFTSQNVHCVRSCKCTHLVSVVKHTHLQPLPIRLFFAPYTHHTLSHACMKVSIHDCACMHSHASTPPQLHSRAPNYTRARAHSPPALSSRTCAHAYTYAPGCRVCQSPAEERITASQTSCRRKYPKWSATTRTSPRGLLLHIQYIHRKSVLYLI